MMAKRIERTGVQLAHPASPRKLEKLGRICIAQPKLNGERCRLEWIGPDEPLFFTSYGNEFPWLEHIKTQLVQLPGKCFPIQFDGELYRHGWPRERIDAAARTRVKRHPDNTGLQFHIFDYVFDAPQLDRINKLTVLKDWFDNEDEDSPIKLVASTPIHVDNWMLQTRLYIEQGYEGIILRDLLSPYTMKRTNAMLKFKPTLKDYYKIVGFEEGGGWAEGMLGAFTVEDKRGCQFNVGTGRALTKEKRQYYWNVRQALLGSYLLVKHEEIKTSGGIPLCTVALDVVSAIPEGEEDAVRQS
jgi:ATP-dependent DNA ligase